MCVCYNLLECPGQERVHGVYPVREVSLSYLQQEPSVLGADGECVLRERGGGNE